MEVTQWVYDMCFSIMAIVGLSVLIGIIAFFLVWSLLDMRTSDEYVKTLDDHDKAVIMTYKSMRWHIKRKKKNEDIS